MSTSNKELEGLVHAMTQDQLRRVLLAAATKFPEVEVLVRRECGEGANDLRQLPNPEDIKDVDDIYILVERAERCIRIGDATHACSLLELVTHRACTDINVLRELVGVSMGVHHQHRTVTDVSSGISAAFFFFLDLSSAWKDCLMMHALTRKRCRKVSQSLRAWQHALTNNANRFLALLAANGTNSSSSNNNHPGSPRGGDMAHDLALSAQQPHQHQGQIPTAPLSPRLGMVIASSSLSSSPPLLPQAGPSASSTPPQTAVATSPPPTTTTATPPVASEPGVWNLTDIGSVFNTPIAISEQRAQRPQQRDDNDTISSCSDLLSTAMGSRMTLDCIPDEIVDLVLARLDATSLVSLGCTCRRLRRLTMSDGLWMVLHERDKALWTAAGSASTRPHAPTTWRQRYLAWAKYPRTPFNAQGPPARAPTMLEAFIGSRRPVDRIALLGSQGSHKQKVLGFLLSNPRCSVGVTAAPPLLPRNMVTNGREWLAGLERPGVSLEIVGTPVYLTILSTLMWPQVFRACNGLVYVLSSQLPVSLPAARDELHRLLNVQTDHSTTPLLVLITDKPAAPGAGSSAHNAATHATNNDPQNHGDAEVQPAPNPYASISSTTVQQQQQQQTTDDPATSSTTTTTTQQPRQRRDSSLATLPSTLTTSPVHVAEYFGLYALQREWRVQYVDLNTFRGVLEGFKWLCFAMKQQV